jgi:outer membrane protein insertion porin family
MKNILAKIVIILTLLINNLNADIINDIQIFGNKRISNETVLVLSNLKSGMDYSNEDLNNSLKKLFETNFFNDIKLSLVKNTLTIELIENPIVEYIELEGIKKTSFKDEIFDKISLKERSSFTKDILENDLNLIQNFLKAKGYFFSKISSTQLLNEDLNSIRVKINIMQGPKSKIKKISFIGDKKIKDRKLRDVILSDEHKFWKFISNTVYLNESIIELDKRLLSNFYKNLGYYDAQVISSYAQFNNDGNFNLIYNINAGDIYYFNNLNLDLPLDYDAKDFRDIQLTLDNLKGKRFSLNRLNKILQDVDRIASTRLYDFIDAEIIDEILDHNKINFTFRIKDTEKFYVERINIFGNYTTFEEVIRNNLIVDEGDPLNNILFNKSIDNIKSLNIFDNVKTNVKEGSNQNLKVIEIEVDEKPTGEISLAAGVGTSGGSIGGGITEKNFLGKGINLKTFLELSEESLKGEFVYSKPNFAYTDNTLFTSLRSVTTDNLTDFGYKVSELGLSIGTGFEQFENLYFNPSLEITTQDLETNSSATSTLKKQQGQYTDLYFNYNLSYDLRDSRFSPKSGFITSFYQELPVISENSELDNTFIFSKYNSLDSSEEMILKSSLYLNTIHSIGSNDVRISKRVNIPYGRLRGFEKGKIGPVQNNDYVGGNYVAALNVSSNLPGFLRTLDMTDFSIFLDAANVWGVDYDSTIDDSNFIRSSTGIALDLRTPIGPLSFSLAQPITKKSTDKTESFRFNLGTTF